MTWMLPPHCNPKYENFQRSNYYKTWIKDRNIVVINERYFFTSWLESFFRLICKVSPKEKIVICVSNPATNVSVRSTLCQTKLCGKIYNLRILPLNRQGVSKKDSLRILAYFIFVTFFTQPQFEAWKFYTWKCVNPRQNNASWQNSVNLHPGAQIHI